MDAIREVIRRPEVTDEDLTAIIGPPDFLTGCEVIGDLASMAAGEPTELTLRARITIDEGNGQVVIEGIPPNIDPDEARDAVLSRARAHELSAQRPHRRRPVGVAVAEVTHFSSRDSDRFACIPAPGTSLEQLRDQLTDVRGISTTVPVEFPAPLPDMVRQWVASHDSEDLLASMASLSDALGGLPGLTVGTVRRILQRLRIPPAPRRSSVTWGSPFARKPRRCWRATSSTSTAR